jgi:hypothetical protein
VNACKQCGKATSNDECPDCRYRQGGPLTDREEHERDVVEVMARQRAAYNLFGAFTPEQLQQINPNER